MTTPEDRLRAAMRAYADEVRPDEFGSLDSIRTKTVVARRRRRTIAAAVAAAAIVAAIVAAVPLVGRSNQHLGVAGGGSTTTTDIDVSPTTTVAPGPTTTPTTSTSTATTAPGALSPTIWPNAALATDNPQDTARVFAADYIGVADPVAGTFQPTGAQDGTVEVHARNDDGSTGSLLGTVSLTQRDGRWFVVGASSPGIVVTSPKPLDPAASPLSVTGRGRGFEGAITVQVRELAVTLGSAHAQGGCCADLAPFSAGVTFSSPSATSGAVVAFNVSAKDGSTLEFSAVPVVFGAGAAATTSFDVFFSLGATTTAVHRTVPKTTGVLTAAVGALLAGPTAEELGQGYSSPFSSASAGLLNGITITSGAAVVDFGDLPAALPGASASAASTELLAELDATVFQYPTVTTVEYRVNGSCDAFSTWLQRTCEIHSRP